MPYLIAVMRNSRHHPLVAAYAEHLQLLVAPGTHRSTWKPVATHAMLGCGCATAVDEWAYAGDDAQCPEHGEQAVVVLATDLIRDAKRDPIDLFQTTLRLFAGAHTHAASLQRALIIREFANDLPAAGPLVSAGYQSGRCCEHQVADWARETGASPSQTADLFAAAGTPGGDAYTAIGNAYTETEPDL